MKRRFPDTQLKSNIKKLENAEGKFRHSLFTYDFDSCNFVLCLMGQPIFYTQNNRSLLYQNEIKFAILDQTLGVVGCIAILSTIVDLLKKDPELYQFGVFFGCGYP